MFYYHEYIVSPQMKIEIQSYISFQTIIRIEFVILKYFLNQLLIDCQIAICLVDYVFTTWYIIVFVFEQNPSPPDEST